MQILANTTDLTDRELELPRWAQRLVLVFWWLFAVSTAILVPAGDADRLASLSLISRALVSPLAPLALWFALHALRHRARQGIRGLELNPAVRFALVGAMCGLALATKFAAHGALSTAPDMPWGLAVLAYFAVYWVVLGAWLLMRGVWSFSHHHVFWIGGLAFALIEENRAVLRAFASGDYLGASLLLAYLIPVYGLPFAATFMLVPTEDLPRARFRPGFMACVACALLPLALYKYWGVAWHVLLGNPLG